MDLKKLNIICIRTMLTQLAIETNTNNVKSLIHRGKKKHDALKNKGHKIFVNPSIY